MKFGLILSAVALAFSAFFSFTANAQTVTRGPYLQSLTYYSIKVMWRTSTSTESYVNYSTDPANLSSTESVSGTRQNHTVLITGLQPFTKYYYSVGTSSQTLSGPDSLHYFVTAPLPGTEQPIRIWGIGDFGKANTGQIDVKNSYLNFNGNRHTDLWLWMGDCAYNDGTDNQYQQKVFDVYDKMFHYMPFYPTPGNHDYLSVCAIPCLSDPMSHGGPYFDIVEVPQFGEAGGVPSGTEAMYSFDYGNMHFVSLNSELGSPTSSNDWTGAFDLNFNGSPMSNWLIADLQANDKPWVVVYFHQCPYTKGSHDSDDFWEIYMGAMRQNFNPIFDSMGVDLVVAGHSHVYERSYLMNGHYGNSSSFNFNTHVVDGSSGNEASGEAYVKYLDGPNPNHGTVYVVIGNSGSSESGAALNHPAMPVGHDGYGSVVVDVVGNRLEAKYLTSTGAILDTFHIIKRSINITNTVDVSICKGESYFAGGANQTISGTYYDTIQTPGQQTSDTIVVTQLTVVQPKVTNRTVTICNGSSYVVGGANQTTAGIYYDSLATSIGCDSVIATELKVDAVITNTIDVSICSGNSHYAGGAGQTVAGTYYDTLLATAGCDSVIITDLSLLPEPYDSSYAEICSGETFVIGGESQSASGVYLDTLTSATGCDSFVVTQLKVNPLPDPPIISASGDTLSVNDGFSSYQWLKGDNPIVGADHPFYVAEEEGVYQVIVSDKKGCESLSVKLSFTFSGVKYIGLSGHINVYPNPTDELLYISFNSKHKVKAVLEMFNILGEKVYSTNTNLGKESFQIDMNEMQAGIYLLSIRMDDEIKSIKIKKE